MISFQSIPVAGETQESPAQDPGRIEAILDAIDAMDLVERLQQYRWTGRQGYPLWAMWRA